MQFNLKAAALLASITAAFGIAIAGAEVENSEKSAVHESETAPTFTMDQDVEVMLLRAGVDPVCLSAAGLQSSSVQSILAANQSGLESSAAQLATLDGSCADAKRSMDALARTVRSGLGTAEDVSSLAQAKATHSSLASQRDDLLAGVVASLTSGLEADEKMAIDNIVASKRWKHLPMKYRVKTRTEAEWVELRNALSAKRTHEKFGDEAPAEAAAHIATMDGDGDVSQAKADCDACLPGVKTLWGQVFAATE